MDLCGSTVSNLWRSSGLRPRHDRVKIGAVRASRLAVACAGCSTNGRPESKSACRVSIIDMVSGWVCGLETLQHDDLSRPRKV